MTAVSPAPRHEEELPRTAGELGNVPDERIRCLVEEAWRQQAPKRLVAERDAEAAS
jgi:hypothetical protein